MVTDLIRTTGLLPDAFDEFFKPWNEWFEDNDRRGRMVTIPAVNIAEDKDNFLISLAAPGMKKEDFRIDVEGSVITVSAENEQTKEESDKTFNRREYNFSSFSRSFSISEDVRTESIAAKYENGILVLTLPKKEEEKKAAAVKSIAVK